MGLLRDSIQRRPGHTNHTETDATEPHPLQILQTATPGHKTHTFWYEPDYYPVYCFKFMQNVLVSRKTGQWAPLYKQTFINSIQCSFSNKDSHVSVSVWNVWKFTFSASLRCYHGDGVREVNMYMILHVCVLMIIKTTFFFDSVIVVIGDLCCWVTKRQRQNISVWSRDHPNKFAMLKKLVNVKDLKY